MGFKIKPKLERYAPTPLSKGWGIMDMKTGEILKKENTRYRIERFGCRAWAKTRCDQLNKEKDLEKCKDQ